MGLTIKHVTIETILPNGMAIGDLSKKYPEVVFSITNGHWISKDERILYITCTDWKNEYIEFLKNHEYVLNLSQISNILKVHLKFKVLEQFEQKEITIVYPTKLRNGHHKIEFLLDEIQLKSLKGTLDNVRIIKITDSYKTTTKLTPRQEEILWKAYSFGYFRYPRGITLTDLAKLLKISKATLSQTLRVVEDKAIKLLLEK